MRIRPAWLLSIAPFVCSIAPPSAESDPAAPSRESLRREVDAYLAPLVESGWFSGTVLLARGGEVLVEAAYGKADLEKDVANEPTTQFKVMSVSNSITAVTVMTLVRAKRIGLDDPVAKHLELWPAAWKDVTVHELLDHTSGIPNLEGEWAG